MHNEAAWMENIAAAQHCNAVRHVKLKSRSNQC